MHDRTGIPSQRTALFASCAFLLVALFAFLWPIAVGQVPVFRDIVSTALPMASFIGARLRAGALPQWFPYEGLGGPFIGQLNEGTFHPSSWLYAVLPSLLALRLQLVLGYAVAALGQLLLARRLGASAAAAALAGLVFACSGYGISLSNLMPYLWGTATLPWIGLCAAGVLSAERPWPWVAALALTWATAVLGGDSHSPLYGGLLVLFVCAALGSWRRFPLCVLAAALAAGLSAVELLPAIDVVARGVRSAWTATNRLSAYWALHPYRWPELLFPNWLPLETGSFFANDRYGEAHQWAFSVFVGVPVVVLALAGARRRLGLAALGLAALGLWLAIGVHGGLEPLLRRTIPFLNTLRYPEKNLAVWTLGIAMAAGAGLDALRARPGPRVPALLFALALACAGAALLLPADVAARIWPRFAAMPNRTALIHASFRASLFSTAGALVVFAAVLAASLRHPRAILLVPLVVLVQLWSANGTAIATASPEALTAPPRFCAAAARAGASASGQRIVTQPSRHAFYVDTDSAEAWVFVFRNLLNPDTGALCGIPTISGGPNLASEPLLLRELFGEKNVKENPAGPLFGFGLAIEAYPEDAAKGERILDGIETGHGAFALVERAAAPRAYAAVPRWVPDVAAAAAAVKRDAALLQRRPVLVGAGPEPTQEGPAGSVRIAAYEPERVVLEAQLERAGAVVLNDLAAPGWTATLDGAPAQLYVANALVRAVLAPAGAHHIEMRFELPRLRAGLAVSGACLALCLALLVFGRAGAARGAGAASARKLA